MGIRKILTDKEPALHKVCKPVEQFDRKLHKLLDDMAETLLSYKTVRLADIAGKDYDTAAVPVEQMADYAAEDADVTLQLADVLLPQVSVTVRITV